MAAWLNSIRVLLNVHNQVDVTSSLTTMLANIFTFSLGVLSPNRFFGGTALKLENTSGL